MTIIIKEKALFVNIGGIWLNLAHAQSINQCGDRVYILWGGNGKGVMEWFTPEQSQKILECLQESTR